MGLAALSASCGDTAADPEPEGLALSEATEEGTLRGVRVLGVALSGDPATGASGPLPSRDAVFEATESPTGLGVLTLTLRDCAAGAEGCRCATGDTCGTGLTCGDGVYRAPCGDGASCAADHVSGLGLCLPLGDAPTASPSKTVVLSTDIHLRQRRLLVNGRLVRCETAPGIPCVDATGTTRSFVYIGRFQPSLNRIDIRIGDGTSAVEGAQVVLDYRTGTFLPGVADIPGIDVTPSPGSTWALGVAGSGRADALSLGALGLAFNRDFTPELRWGSGQHPRLAVVYSGAGNDAIGAMGNLAPRSELGIGGGFPAPVELAGGPTVGSREDSGTTSCSGSSATTRSSWMRSPLTAGTSSMAAVTCSTPSTSADSRRPAWRSPSETRGFPSRAMACRTGSAAT